jgi:hypothetical protein
MLIDDAAVASRAADGFGLGLGARLNQDLALAWQMGSDDGAEECRFSASAGSQERNERSGLHIQRYPVDRSNLPEFAHETPEGQSSPVPGESGQVSHLRPVPY